MLILNLLKSMAVFPYIFLILFSLSNNLCSFLICSSFNFNASSTSSFYVTVYFLSKSINLNSGLHSCWLHWLKSFWLIVLKAEFVFWIVNEFELLSLLALSSLSSFEYCLASSCMSTMFFRTLVRLSLDLLLAPKLLLVV